MIKKRDLLLLLVFVSIHIFILFNLQFAAWPEMFSYPYLRNNGFLIYKDVIHPYPPLLTMVLSVLFKIFGYKVLTLRIFTYLLVLTNDLLVILLSKKILKKNLLSFIPLLFYVLTQPFLDGNMLWFDFATTTPILLSLFFLFKVIQKKNLKRNLVLSGIFLTIATLIKQTSGIFFVISVIFLLFKKFKVKDILLIFLGPLIMGLLLLMRLIQEKALYDFLNWTLIYPSRCWTNFPGYVRMDIARADLITLAVLFIPFIAFIFRIKKHFRNNNFILTFIFFLCSFVTVYPRFSFFHLQTLLAVIPIMLVFLLKNKPKEVIIGLVITSVLFSYRNIYPKVRTDWRKETRFFGFEEKALSQIIKDNSKKEDKVYLLGLNSNLYSLSERIPPKRWFDNFGWYLEIEGVQEEILERWQKEPPEIILWKAPSLGGWYELGVYQPKKITDFIIKNYNRENEPYPGVTLWRLNRK